MPRSLALDTVSSWTTLAADDALVYDAASLYRATYGHFWSLRWTSYQRLSALRKKTTKRILHYEKRLASRTANAEESDIIEEKLDKLQWLKGIIEDELPHHYAAHLARRKK